MLANAKTAVFAIVFNCILVV